MQTQSKRVRRAPVTGLNKRRRAHKGIIYLSSEWYGKNVIVTETKEFRRIMREYRSMKLKLKHVEKEVTK